MFKKKIILLLLIILTHGCHSKKIRNHGNHYNVVIDSGSSGNRLFIYEISPPYNFPIITPLFEISNEIPLASFSNNPEDSGKIAIQPLLNEAETFLNANHISINSVIANDLGTAGMRLLAQTNQQAIYLNVAQTLTANGFILGETATLSGQKEGLYAWVDVNYLTGGLKSGNSQGIVEVGGASAQVAFHSSMNTDNQNIIKLCAYNNNYNVYIYGVSYLGLGQNEARDAMNSGSNYNKCYPYGYTNMSLNITGAFNFDTCSSNYEAILNEPQYGTLPQISLIPGFADTAFIGLSSIYFTFNFFGLASDPTQLGLESAIMNTCNLNYTILEMLYPDAYKLYNQCANATYINSFLYNSLQMGNTQLSTALTINNTNLTWTLGFVFVQNTDALSCPQI